MDKNYLEVQYKQTVREYKAALTESNKWVWRKAMARLETLAAQEYGFEYADELHKLCEGCQ